MAAQEGIVPDPLPAGYTEREATAKNPRPDWLPPLWRLARCERTGRAVFISPFGKICYHKQGIERVAAEENTLADALEEDIPPEENAALEDELLAARGDVAGLEAQLKATLSDDGARLYDELGVAQRRLAALEEERRAALYEDPRLLAAGQRIRGLEDEANRLRQPRAALEEELADAHAHSSLMHRNLEHIQEDNAHYGARLLEQRDELIQLRRQLDAEQQLRLEQAAQIGSEARTLPSERTEASLRAESAEWRETAANDELGEARLLIAARDIEIARRDDLVARLKAEQTHLLERNEFLCGKLAASQKQRTQVLEEHEQGLEEHKQALEQHGSATAAVESIDDAEPLDRDSILERDKETFARWQRWARERSQFADTRPDIYAWLQNLDLRDGGEGRMMNYFERLVYLDKALLRKFPSCDRFVEWALNVADVQELREVDLAAVGDVQKYINPAFFEGLDVDSEIHKIIFARGILEWVQRDPNALPWPSRCSEF